MVFLLSGGRLLVTVDADWKGRERIVMMAEFSRASVVAAIGVN